ncbi:MAG: hypothetical protein RL120_05095, partial [Gammaproteobacteria bacterium]
FVFGGTLSGGVLHTNSSSSITESNTVIHGFHQGYFIGNSTTPGFVLTFSYDRFLNASSTVVNDLNASGDASLVGSVLFNDSGLSNPFVLSTAERQSLTRRGFAVFNNDDGTATGPNSIIQGAASGTANPIITSTASSSSLSSFWPFFSFQVLRQNTADSFIPLDQPSEDYDLQWGLWEGVDGDQANLFPNSYNSSVSPTGEPGQIVIATFTPTPIAQLIGSRVFRADESIIANFEGPGDIGLNDARGGFDMNFDTGMMNNLRFEICLGDYCGGSPTDWWYTYEEDDIQVKNGQVDLVSLNGFHSGDSSGSFTGSLSGSFIGNSGPEGFTAGFRFVDTNGDTLGGGLLFQDTQFLTLAESSALNSSGRLGVVTFPNEDYATLGTSNLLGLATDGSNGSPLFGMNSDYYYGGFTDPLVDGEDYLLARRNNAGLTNHQTSVGGFDMDWGFWVSNGEDAS